MVKIISSLIITLFLIVLTINTNQNHDKKMNIGVSNAYASGCTICHTSFAECHRIIIGTETRIHYGDAEDCSEPGESE
jgi:hypothetical protein